MSNTISISEQIHPITEKLLNGELSLSEVTLEDFDSGRIIYETAKKARCSGFDAEHLISTATQIKKYNSSHNTTYDPNDRETFQKLTGALDDRCFRLTKFEHIVRHYLKAQLDNYELSVFIGMKNFHYGKLNKPEKDTLESMTEWAETCKTGYLKSGETISKKFSDKDSDFYKNWHNRLNEGHSTIEASKNISNSRKEVEARRKIEDDMESLYNKEGKVFKRTTKSSDNIRKIQIDAQSKCKDKKIKSLSDFWTNITEEEYKSFCEHRKEIANRPENIEKYRQGTLNFLRNESDEHKRWKIERIKSGYTEESKLKRKQKIDLHKEVFCENVRKGVIKYYENVPGAREKTSSLTKESMNTPEMVDIRKRIKEDYEYQKKSLGENYVRWNDFQKEWFIKNKGSN